MADFGRINPDNGAFEIAPVNFTAPDGTTIMNFYLDENMMSEYGFKPVLMPPEPETGSEEFAVPRYTDEGDRIRVHWEIISTTDPSEETNADGFDEFDEPDEYAPEPETFDNPEE